MLPLPRPHSWKASTLGKSVISFRSALRDSPSWLLLRLKESQLENNFLTKLLRENLTSLRIYPKDQWGTPYGLVEKRLALKGKATAS